MVVDIPDVLTYKNFGDHRLRGFWAAGGQISPSPFDFHRRPYNTLALPCERVVSYVDPKAPGSFGGIQNVRRYCVRCKRALAVYSHTA